MQEPNEIVTKLTQVDSQGDPLNMTIVAGDDKDVFEIDYAVGTLRFKEPPDFDAPIAKYFPFNTYEVVLLASDRSL